MKVTTITISGQVYPIFFGGLALSSLFKEFEAEGLVDLVEKTTVKDKDDKGKKNPNKTMSAIIDKTCKIAFAGIKNGCLIQKQPFPFESVDDLMANISSINEVTPAMSLYVEAMASFFTVEETTSEKSEGEEAGAVVAVPLPS